MSRDDRGRACVDHLLEENQKLRLAIQRIDQTLRVPAAEYVPAIRDVFEIIDGLKCATAPNQS